MEFKDLEQIVISQAQEIAELRAEVATLRKTQSAAPVFKSLSDPTPRTVAEVEARWQAVGGPHNYVEAMAKNAQLSEARHYEGLED